MKKIFSLLGGIATTVIIALSSYSFTSVAAFTQEQEEAYQWAYKYGLTTQPTIEAARMNSPLTRQAFAKMVVKYLENVVGVKQSPSTSCYFLDESKITNDLVPYTKKTCAYQIMGSNGKNFNPTQQVNRAQLGTVLSRILWGDQYNSNGKGYYIYHLNALKQSGIMNNINNPTASYAKRGDVLIMLKRTYEKFGSNIYLNGGKSDIYSNQQTTHTENSVVKEEMTTIKEDFSDDEYLSSMYSNSNVIYTGNDGKKYYYDDKFLSVLKNTAENKGESDLAKYLEIEIVYFKDGLNQLSDLDDEDLLESMGIDVDSIDPENMTKQEKQELIKKFKSGLGKIINENKDNNNQFLKDLEKVTKNINKDKFGLKDKLKETKTFIDASNSFLDLYSESILGLIELALMSEEGEDSEEGMTQALGLIGIALAYQGEADKYQKYVEEWAVDAVKLLGGNLDTSNTGYGTKVSVNNSSKMTAAETRARDVSRKADLSQIQTAIVVWQGDYGKWPGVDIGATKGITTSSIGKELTLAGMRYIPEDPSNSVNYGLGENYQTKAVKGDYLYLVAKRNGTSNAGFVLMSKQELAGGSNWVVCKGKSGLENGYITNDTDLANIKTCSEVKKGNSCSASACTYTSDDELRYIVIY